MLGLREEDGERLADGEADAEALANPIKSVSSEANWSIKTLPVIVLNLSRVPILNLSTE